MSRLVPAFLALVLSGPAVAYEALPPIWTGMYAGLHVGGGNFKLDSPAASFSETAPTLGGHLGINVEAGPVLLGVEADVGVDLVEADGTAFIVGTATQIPFSAKVGASGTLRARIGVPVGPALFYATAGYAWTDVKFTVAGAGLPTGSATHSFGGLVYGIGAEMKVMERVSLRVEALRFDYEKDHLSFSGVVRSVDAFDPSATVVRAGVSFSFN